MALLFDREFSGYADQRWHELVEFLRENQEFPHHHRSFHLAKTCYAQATARGRLHAIFAAALQSNDAGGLRLSGRLARTFQRRIERLGEAGTVPSDQFLDCFGAKNLKDVFHWLIGRTGIGKKKAALFTRDLALAQENHGLAIFEDDWMEAGDRYIPLDIVIATTLNRLFPPRTFKLTSHPSYYFDKFDQFARNRLGVDYMLLEDLWYWGFFCLRSPVKKKGKKSGDDEPKKSKPKGKIGTRQLRFNWDKYLLDPAFIHEQNVPAHFEAFIDLVSQ